MSESRSSFRPDIEGLRAVAVILVIANHVYGWPRGGFIGVDVFFVISGYLITGLLVHERERTGGFDVRNFYARRIRRILPAAVVVLVVTDLVARWLFVGVRAGQTVTDSFWAAAFAANFHFASIGVNYFDQTRAASPVQHYWSLSVEEQFYLVWPWLLILAWLVGTRVARRRGAVTVTAMTSLLVVASLLWSIHLTSSSATAAYFSTPARGFELGVGALLALQQQRLAKLPALAGAALGWAGIATMAISVVVITATTPFPGAWAALPVGATAMLLVAGSASGGPGGRWFLANPVMRFVGRISYSLYLWHWPCLVFADSVWLSTSIQVRFGVPVVALLLATASYRFVEQPIRSSTWLSRGRTAAPSPRAAAAGGAGGRRWIRPLQRLGIAALAAGVVVVIVGAVSGGSHPASLDPAAAARVRAIDAGAESVDNGVARQRLHSLIVASLAPAHWPALSPTLASLATAGPPEWLHDGCLDVSSANESRCRYSGANPTHLAVLLGDSHAISLMPGLREVLEPRGWAIQSLTLGQCPNADVTVYQTIPSDGPYTACNQHRSWAINEIKRLHPSLVILEDRAKSVTQVLGLPPGANPALAWQNGLETTLRQVIPAAGRVVVVSDTPGSDDLQTCVTRFSTPSDCTIALSPTWRQMNIVERTAAGATGATYIDLEPLLCAEGRCPAVIGSTPVYMEGGHLTAAYSRELMPFVTRALLGPAAS